MLPAHRRPALVALAAVWLAATLGPLTVASPAAAASRPSGESMLDDPVYLDRVQDVLDLVYDLELTRAERLARELARERPGHPVGPLLQVLPTWWAILLDPADTSRDAALEAAVDEALDRAERRLDRDRDDRDGLFFKAAALAFRARLGALRNEWISAAHDGHTAFRILRRLARDQPHNHDLGFGLGLYDYFADVLPERHAIFRPLAAFFPDGDREVGLARLRLAAEHGRYSRTEAAYFLLQIHYHLEGNEAQSRALTAELRRRHPGNALFHLYEARVAARWGSCDAADESLDLLLERHRAGATGYTDAIAATGYWVHARCELDRGRYGATLVRLRRLDEILARRPPSSLGVLSALGRGMAYDALGRRGDAVREYRRVLAMDDAGGAHDRARDFLAAPFHGAGVRDATAVAASPAS